MRNGHVAKAKALLDRLIADGVEDSSVFALLSQALRKLGKTAAAISAIVEAISRNNIPAHYHGLLATMLASKSEWDDAYLAAHEARKREPTSWRWILLEWYLQNNGSKNELPPYSLRHVVKKLLTAYFAVEATEIRGIPDWKVALSSIERSCK